MNCRSVGPDGECRSARRASATAGRVEPLAMQHISCLQPKQTGGNEMLKGLGLSMALILGGMVGLPAAILAVL